MILVSSIVFNVIILVLIVRVLIQINAHSAIRMQ